MNLTVVLIIVVTIVLVIGPLLWLRPSPRDRQLERLRNHARSCGLTVAVKEVPDPDPHFSDRVSSGGKLRNPTLSVALYQVPLHLPSTLESRHVPRWEVVRMRQDAAADTHDELSAGLRAGWRFGRPGLPLIERVVGRLNDLLGQAPRGTVKVEGDAAACGLYWMERGDEAEVDRIAGLLRDACELQIELCQAAAREEALRQESSDDD